MWRGQHVSLFSYTLDVWCEEEIGVSLSSCTLDVWRKENMGVSLSICTIDVLYEEDTGVYLYPRCCTPDARSVESELCY